MSIQFNYFYGSEAEQFTFYRIPKALFKDEMFKDLSTDAKLLYGLMLDRMGLSVKNRWFDDENRVYIIYTISDIMEDFGCAEQKANKLLCELDAAKGMGLISRKRMGLGKPNIIYVKNFVMSPQNQNCENHKSGHAIIANQEFPKTQIQNCENDSTAFVNIEKQEMRKPQSNNTDYSNTEFSDTEFLSYPIHQRNRNASPSPPPAPDAIGWIEERKSYERLIKKNIDYDIIVTDYGADWLDEIVALMVDVVCSREPTIRINRQDYPREVVKSRFLKIDSTHIEYIHFALKENTSNVRNIRAFLITTIYRSTETTDNWFSAKVNHDMAKGG